MQGSKPYHLKDWLLWQVCQAASATKGGSAEGQCEGGEAAAHPCAGAPPTSPVQYTGQRPSSPLFLLSTDLSSACLSLTCPHPHCQGDKAAAPACAQTLFNAQVSFPFHPFLLLLKDPLAPSLTSALQNGSPPLCWRCSYTTC